MTQTDTSIYEGGPEPVNPLENLSRIVGVANSLNQNKLFQSEYAARQGLGQAAQGAIDDNGNFNPQAYANQLVANKNTAYMAAQGLQQGLEIQHAQNANKIQQYSLAKQKNDMETASLRGLLNNPALSKKDINSAMADTVINSMDENGKPLINASDVLGYFGPRKDANGQVIDPGLDALDDNPAVLNKYLSHKYANGQALAGNLDNAMTALYSKNLALKPDAQVVGQGPNGRPAMVANTTASPMGTVSDQAQGGSPQGSVAGLPPVQQGQVSPLAGAFKQGQQPSAQPQGNNVMLSLPPGQEGMMNAGGANAADRVNQTLDQAKSAKVLQDADQQIVNLAQGLGSGKIGPVSTEVTETLGKLADTPVIGPLLKAAAAKDPTDTAGQLMVLQKYLARRAQLGGQAAGAKTDFTEGLNLEANPHDKQFAPVLAELARYNLALDMMTQGKADALQNTPNATVDPATQEKFENDYRNAANVDVYRAMLAPKEERAKIFNQMTPAQKQQLIQSRRKLLEMKAIPSQMQSPSE